jgi:hypothetical protein
MRTMHGSRVRQGEAIMFNVHVITILPRISHDDIDKHPKKMKHLGQMTQIIAQMKLWTGKN